GLSLSQAIGKLQQRGLHVIYSTDLVKPWMRIRTEPTPAPPDEMLSEILAPFALRVRDAAADIYAVVREERRSGAPVRPQRASPGPDAARRPAALEETVV